MLVAQSYHIFNRYGKDNEALKDIARAFIEDLSEYREEQITNAFRSWREKSSGMPTPSNIIEEIKGVQNTETGGLKKFQHWEGSWQSYLEYLEKNHILSSNMVWKNGKIQLKDGYYPEWTAKDFR